MNNCMITSDTIKEKNRALIALRQQEGKARQHLASLRDEVLVMDEAAKADSIRRALLIREHRLHIAKEETLLAKMSEDARKLDLELVQDRNNEYKARKVRIVVPIITEQTVMSSSDGDALVEARKNVATWINRQQSLNSFVSGTLPETDRHVYK